CPTCSIRKRIPFKGNLRHLLRTQRMAGLSWISFVLEDLQNFPLQKQIKASLESTYGELWDDLVCFNQVTLGTGGPHTKRQKCPEEKDAAVLITIESHSVETGEVLLGRNSRNSTMKYALLSEEYVRRSENPLKGMIVLTCGSTLEVKESREDMETLMRRLELNFIVGFPAMFVNPTTISDTINSFCVALYCKSMSVMEGFLEVFGGRREFLSSCPVVLMERDASTEVSRKVRSSPAGCWCMAR
ncbi:hypothetical protein EV363DRAFT_1203388, partial [Boletus edulis]